MKSEIFLICLVVGVFLISGCVDVENSESVTSQNAGEENDLHKELSELAATASEAPEELNDNTEASEEINCTEILYRTTEDGYYDMSLTQEENTKCKSAIIYYNADGLPVTFSELYTTHDLMNDQNRQWRENLKAYRTSPYNAYSNTITGKKMYYDSSKQEWIVVTDAIKEAFDCSTLPDEFDRNDCYFYKAIFYARDSSLCEKITNEAEWARLDKTKEDCIRRSGG